MVLLPEDTAMTLSELRQMAMRQQNQIEAQQQLLKSKEQRLKFLKQQEARHHSLADHQLDTDCLQTLRDKIETQEHKLRQLRALRGQVEHQKTNNENLGIELDSIRALFSEKEKELNLAVSKVEELSRQLDEIRNMKNHKNNFVSSAVSEIESLRRELLYRTKLSEQQNTFICQQREDIALRQQDISALDKKIGTLTQRLHRKRLLNDQLAAQIRNASALSRSFSSSAATNGFYSATIAAVEPLPRDPLEPEKTRDDMAAKLHGSHKGDLGEFTVNKNDPKYQTLPYNTKFNMKGRVDDSMSSSNEEDSWPNSLDSSASVKRNPPMSVVKPSKLATDLSASSDTKDSILENGSRQIASKHDVLQCLDKTAVVGVESKPVVASIRKGSSEKLEDAFAALDVSSELSPVEKINEKPKVAFSRSAKPAVPPKPALPVKPMIASRPAPQLKGKPSNEKDAVNAALNVLQNQTSKTEKSASRYPHTKENKSASSPKSKIATYFHKPDAQESHKNGISQEGEALKRKPSGQLPIKPKPLTIRKTPGLEPPKLKVQPVVGLNLQRKTSDSNLSNHSKLLNAPSVPEGEDLPKAAKSNKAINQESSIPVVQVSPLKKELEDSTGQQQKERQENDLTDEVPSTSDTADEVDLCRFPKIMEKSEIAPEIIVVENDPSEKFHSSALRRIRKGNLKGEDHSRICRRVSFDPLALLLDAALEGELELVKKTAKEVSNPSAANDEGITALHNAICAGHIDVATFLVEFGCDVNAQDCDGWTPLHCAASCNNLPMVKFLVERGACIFATTLSDQETAAEKCEEDEDGFEGCSEYLYSLQENLGLMNGGEVYAVYDYEAQNPDELGFRDGDALAVLRKGDDDESEWWWSRLADEEGYVPRNLLGLYPRVQCNTESNKTLD